MRIVPVLARIAFALAAAGLAVMLAAGFGTRLGLWTYQTGLGDVLPLGMAITATGFGMGLIWLLTSRLLGVNEHMREGLTGLIGAAAFLVLPLYHLYMERISPPIHDISTDTEHPPPFKELLTLRAGAENPPDYDGGQDLVWEGEPRTVREVQRKAYGDIHSIAILTSPENLFARAQRAAEDMGWSIVAVVPDEGRIEATDTSFFFGFTDDIVIRVKPSGMGARIDIRSKSRQRENDAGANAERIRAYIKRLADT